MFHYIDGAADDEITQDRNTAAFDDVDLVPDVLAGVETVDPSGDRARAARPLPLLLSPTALQRLFHWQGERAVAAAAEKFGLWFGISSLASVGIEEIGAQVHRPQDAPVLLPQGQGAQRRAARRARPPKFDAVALTVDTIVGGNRERCLRTGFTSPPRITPASFGSGYAIKPRWALDYLFREKFSLPNLEAHVPPGRSRPRSAATSSSCSTSRWTGGGRAAARRLGRQVLLKGVMSVGDARRAVGMGCDAIMISNHGGRQLDGSRAPFDQLAEIVDAVGDRME